MLLLIADDTVKTYLPEARYEELRSKDDTGLIKKYYTKCEGAKGFSLVAEKQNMPELYSCMAKIVDKPNETTILAVEEPEAHLHPIYQRLLYRHIVNSGSSVIITTHSTHITSVAPIDSIVHLTFSPHGTDVKTTAGLTLSKPDRDDLQRYIDVKRGEVYLAKAIITDGDYYYRKDGKKKYGGLRSDNHEESGYGGIARGKSLVSNRAAIDLNEFDF